MNSKCFTFTRTDGHHGLLALAGEVTVADIRDLHVALCADGLRYERLEVDGRAVTRIDAAALQLLIVAARCAGSAHVLKPSPAWAAAFVRYGFCDPFVHCSIQETGGTHG